MLGTSAEFLPVISRLQSLARQAGGWHRAASVGVRDLSLTVARRAFDRINSAVRLYRLHHGGEVVPLQVGHVCSLIFGVISDLSCSEMICALRLLQNDPDHENQCTNNPKEDLGILGPLPILHFPLTFSPSSTGRAGCVWIRSATGRAQHMSDSKVRHTRSQSRLKPFRSLCCHL
jgi:hypothetical protein